MRLVAIVIRCGECSATNRLLVSGSSRGRPICGTCRTPLLELAVVNGFLYVLSNPAMPGLLKIGFTNRSVEERVKQLNAATGAPAPFGIEAYFASPEAEDDERKVHLALEHCRAPNKEFFAIKVPQAMEIMTITLGRRPVFRKGTAASDRNDVEGAWS